MCYVHAFSFFFLLLLLFFYGMCHQRFRIEVIIPLDANLHLFSLNVCALFTIRRLNPAEGGLVAEEHGQEERQPHPPQRQVIVRRFQFGFQLDLLLILKLAAVVFLFNQDGSRQRLMLLLFFAFLIYL